VLSWRVVSLGLLLVVAGTAAGVWVAQDRAPTTPPLAGQLPPGHPSLAEPPPGPSVPAPPAGSGAGSQGLTWTAPSGWTVETPISPMRRAQYRIAGPGGPAEGVVFYFGPGQGGDARTNVARWAGQFQRPDGTPVGDRLKTRELRVGDVPVTVVEVTGTYVGGMGGAPAGPPAPDQMLLGAIAEGPDARWFFRAMGPRATLEKERQAFERMIRSIKRAG